MCCWRVVCISFTSSSSWSAVQSLLTLVSGLSIRSSCHLWQEEWRDYAFSCKRYSHMTANLKLSMTRAGNDDALPSSEVVMIITSLNLFIFVVDTRLPLCCRLWQRGFFFLPRVLRLQSTLHLIWLKVSRLMKVLVLNEIHVKSSIELDILLLQHQRVMMITTSHFMTNEQHKKASSIDCIARRT